MSWGGSGGFFGPKTPIAGPPGAGLTGGLDRLRQTARESHAQGRLLDAMQTQIAVLALGKAAGERQVNDFLFAGLLYDCANRPADGVATLQEAIALYPNAPELHENLAVFLLGLRDLPGCIDAANTALSLGSLSPNVHDCLCEAHQHAGNLDHAVAAGRTALEAKDQRFGSAAPIVPPPERPPEPFNPERPEENVIAYSLWGDDPRYQVPLLENARIQPHLFPTWTLRVYHDPNVDPSYLAELAKRGVQLRPMVPDRGVPAHRGLLWRFEAIADPSVRRFLIRDADSLLTVKERVAVDAWLASNHHFHAMRDWYTHTDLLLAGMWGGVGGILPPPAALLQAHIFFRTETNHIDQDILRTTVWPVVRNHILIHDSIFQPCLGSVPVPPVGTLPTGHHIGENAFLHFTKSG